MARTVALTWNLDTGKLSAATDYLKRAENVSFVLTCYTASTKTLLPENWGLVLALKPDDDYDSNPLTRITSWAEDATAKTYTATTTAISSTAIDTLLAKDADGTNDIADYDCNIEVNYTVSGLVPIKSDTLPIILKNDVSRTDDATPAAAVVPDDDWLAHGHSQSLSSAQKLQGVTNLGINLTASKLLGQASSGGTGLPVAITLGSGLTMTASTLSATAPGGVAWGDVTGTLSAQTDLNNALALKAPLASPAFTGTPTGVTADASDNSTKLATTAYVDGALPTDYEITSAYGRRLIASLKTVWPVASSLAGILYFAITKIQAGSVTVRTTTGYARVIDHRGTLLTQVGTGNANADITLTYTQVNVGQRALAVISVANGGSVRSGDITQINATSGELTVLDVTSATALTSLTCAVNQLSELDVSTNTALTSLNCESNQLTALDVSANTALTSLNCSSNQLTELDVASNTALTSLNCSSNQLTELDVASNTALTSIIGGTNQLTELDVSANVLLITLNLHVNLLTTAVVDQILVDLDALNVAGTLVAVGGTGNGAASATGIAAAAALIIDGWGIVSYN